MKHKIKTLFVASSLLALAACNKGSDNFSYKGDMLPVTLKGYNASGTELDVKLDTFKYDLIGSLFDRTEAYIVPQNKSSIKLSVTERTTGKVLLEKQLKKEDGPAKFSFFYIDGKTGDMPEKAAIEEGTIKISYMFMPTLTNYSEPVDIVLGKYYVTPKVLEEMAIIKNVKPYQFSETVTLPTFSTAMTQYNGVNTIVSFVVYIYKAGSKEFYTTGTPYTVHATLSTAPKPAASVASSKLYIFSESAAGNSLRFTKNFEQ